jgi:hypothetical protein
VPLTCLGDHHEVAMFIDVQGSPGHGRLTASRNRAHLDLAAERETACSIFVQRPVSAAPPPVVAGNLAQQRGE